MIVMLLTVVIVASTFCTSSRKAVAAKPDSITYTDNIQHIMTARCSPCHMPTGNKEQLNTFATVRDHIDEIITRIQLNPGEKGFMPMRHPKLSADTINLFVQWKAQGLPNTKP